MEYLPVDEGMFPRTEFDPLPTPRTNSDPGNPSESCPIDDPENGRGGLGLGRFQCEKFELALLTL